MADAIEGGAEFPDFSNVSFGDGLTDGEKALLLKANQCIRWLNVQTEDIAKTIRKVMRSIIKGQSNDLKNSPLITLSHCVRMRSLTLIFMMSRAGEFFGLRLDS